MARLLRVQFEGAIYHVTARGNDRRPIFLDDRDRDRFIEKLEENVDILHELADLLLEKETVSGAELDELIFSMRPGIVLPSMKNEADKTAAEDHTGETATDDHSDEIAKEDHADETADKDNIE